MMAGDAMPTEAVLPRRLPLLRASRTLRASIAVVLLTGLWWYAARDKRALPEAQYVLHTVSRVDLPITVVERGRLESQQVIELKCEVETMPGQRGVRIVYIVPNGSKVKAGQLLVEFDSAPIEEALDRAYVDYERAKARKLQADAAYENMEIQAQIALELAKLTLEKAQMRLRQFEDKEGGTFAIDLQEAELRVQEARNKLVEAQARLLLEKTKLEGIRMLYRLGYRGKGDLDQATFQYLQAEDGLVRATNSLRTAEAALRKLKQYDYPLQKLELTTDVENARRKLEQVRKQNAADLARLKADRDAAARELAKMEERLKKYRRLLEKCKIYSPCDGVAVYSRERTPWGRYVGEGELVHERMTVITIPDLTHMQVDVDIHEAVLDQVQPGQPCTITVDAVPDRVFKGTVKSVATMPSRDRRWYARDVNKYETIVTIDEEVSGLNPGMTASVEILVDKIEDTIAVPIQAVLEVDDQAWCFVVDAQGRIERRKVELGADNDKLVQILSGLEEGEQIVLNPRDLPAELLPEEQQDQRPVRSLPLARLP